MTKYFLVVLILLKILKIILITNIVVYYSRVQPREMRGGGDKQCPLDPYFILPDKCSCVDFQTLKLQELLDGLPQGEMPRHLQLYVDRQLCDKVVPGNRVVITGIYSIKKVMSGGKVILKFNSKFV